MNKPRGWLRNIVGTPERGGLPSLTVNLLVFVAAISGLVFFVSDLFFLPDLGHLAYDLGMFGVFGFLYWQSRFRLHHRLVAHIGAVATIGFFTSNFFLNAGIVGPTLMVTVMMLGFITIVHSRGFAALYFALGSVASVLCLVAQALHPQWIRLYPSPTQQFWDMTFSFAFCLTMTYFVMRMVMRFFDDILARTAEAQSAVVQSEKMVALGEMTANLAHEIKSPVAVIGSALWIAENWWREDQPRSAAILRGLAADQDGAFWNVLTRGTAAVLQPLPDRRAERVMRARIRQQFVELGVEDADTWAEELASINLEWDASWNPLIRDEAGRDALAWAFRALTLHRSNVNAQSAYESLHSLVMALGTYSRTDDAGEPPRATSLAEGLATVLTLYGAGYKNAVDIVREFAAVPDIEARPDELIQVWTNLVQNALQAMDGKGTLTVSLQREDRWAVVTISDTGPGVPPELRERVFAPFFTTKAQGAGTGLGLGIVMKIVSAHGGLVAVRDAPGGGAAFEVRLPLSGVEGS